MVRTVKDQRHETGVKKKQRKFALVAQYKLSVVIWHAKMEKFMEFGEEKLKESVTTLATQ